MTPWAAKWIACWEDPHWRSTVVAGGEHGGAADVERLLAHLHDAARDHVVDQGGVEVVALHERLQGLGGEIDGVPVAQLAVALPPGGANGIDDDGGGHGASLERLAGRPARDAAMLVLGLGGPSGPRVASLG
jgi:hypothetical protein